MKTHEDSVKVIIDYRELKSQVSKELYELDVRLVPASLPAGDYIASERVGIERKSQEDFLQSVVNGRIFAQAKNLANSFERPIIVLEGREDIYSLRNLHENAIRGAMSSLIIDYEVPILRTEDCIDTARFIAGIARREQLDLGKEVQIRGDKRAFSPTEWQEFIVASLPGVGRILAKNLLRKFGSVEGVFGASEGELRQVRKIGKKKATKIVEIIKKRYG